MEYIINTLSFLLIINILFAVSIVFLERKDPQTTLAWLMVLIFIPGLGFFLYLFFGQNLKKEKMFKLKESEDRILKNILKLQENELDKHEMTFYDPTLVEYKDIIKMNIKTDDSFLTQNNEIAIFTDGNDKYKSLISDIENAKSHIHLLYYIFNDDEIGNKIIDTLIRKLDEGVKVKLLYDDVGCSKTNSELFLRFEDHGGETAPFFPFILPRFHFRLNFRNHRKIAIIDGKTGYIGGFNIGDEYLGKNHNLGNWRDTHLRITGDAVYALQIRFLMDWEYASKEKPRIYDENRIKRAIKKYDYVDDLFPINHPVGKKAVQIVSSGPDSDSEQIKYGYLKLINRAKESIFIQSPYFIPDSSIVESLKIAALSGVDVRIMIPCKPDHPFVYWATLSNAAELLNSGVRIYRYMDGFLHSKTIVVDGRISSVGTANWDVRSFKLNFEVNSFIYDKETSKALNDFFLKDLTKSSELTKQAYENRKITIKVKESFSRLLSPLL
ncbi:MAG TPA: cardiolipin synthase [Thermotogota bacterium]|nr:cardiolipin synthase [Thermotogota bacterium]HPJ87959.1 cardiolipin synthase [Thermotogota bacterium]